MSQRKLVLGVDGGGTKSLGLVADDAGNVLARHETVGTNPNVFGFEVSAKRLFDLINALCEQVRLTPDELGCLVLGIAGAGGESESHRLRDAVGSLFGKKGIGPVPLTVVSDARIALEGSFSGGPGVIIIAGTGSVAFGKTEKMEVLQVGGWGRVLGDEGSGYDIGREALRAVTLDYDRRGDSGALRRLLAEKFKLDSRERLITAVYAEQFEIPSLAPLVFEAAAAHDLVSQRILQKAASTLADQAAIIVKRMGIRRKVGLVLTGGLLDPQTIYTNVLHMKLLRVLPQVEVRPPAHSPAHGAMYMALELMKGR